MDVCRVQRNPSLPELYEEHIANDNDNFEFFKFPIMD